MPAKIKLLTQSHLSALSYSKFLLLRELLKYDRLPDFKMNCNYRDDNFQSYLSKCLEVLARGEVFICMPKLNWASNPNNNADVLGFVFGTWDNLIVEFREALHFC